VSISEGVAPCGTREWITTRLLRACAGKSHSWLTPKISLSRPSANSISVADGRSETIRISRLYHTQSQLTPARRTLAHPMAPALYTFSTSHSSQYEYLSYLYSKYLRRFTSNSASDAPHEATISCAGVSCCNAAMVSSLPTRNINLLTSNSFG
jgi:hypothetical protein